MFPLIPADVHHSLRVSPAIANEEAATNKILVAVVSAAEFVRAQGCICELSFHYDYADWIDSRYGRYMGLSLGGADASIVTVALDDFLNWWDARRVQPSEAALDVFAQNWTLCFPSAAAGG
jgi:hypothetical protein